MYASVCSSDLPPSMTYEQKLWPHLPPDGRDKKVDGLCIEVDEVS